MPRKKEITVAELWDIAHEQAVKEYEEEYGSWEDADKYEREDCVFAVYMKLKENYNVKEK